MTEEAPEASSPTEALAELQSDKEWSADFSGDNGRIAQRKAAERKTALLRGGDPEPAPVPEHLREAMGDSETRPHAERYIPAQSADEYRFDFRGADSVEHAKEMTAVARETAFAIGAPREYAEATVKHIQERIGRVTAGASVEANPGSLDAAMSARYGSNAPAMTEAAAEAVMAMPEAGRRWVQATLRGLDPETATWFVSRLASVRRIVERK